MGNKQNFSSFLSQRQQMTIGLTFILSYFLPSNTFIRTHKLLHTITILGIVRLKRLWIILERDRTFNKRQPLTGKCRATFR